MGLRDAIGAFRDDWRGQWLSLICGVSVVFAFSQAWQAPLFGYTTPLQSGPLIQLFYYPFYACGLILVGLAGWRMLDAAWRTPVLLALTCMDIISIIWSIDPSGTLRRFVALAATVLCGYALASRFSWRRLSEVLAIAFSLMALITIVLGVAFPHLGKMQELFVGAWRGPWIEKNSLGSTMAIGFIATMAAALENRSRRWLWGAMALVMVLLVLLSTSKTSLVGVMLGIGGVSLIWLMQRGPIFALSVTWMVLTGLILITGVILIDSHIVFALLGKDATLTGRTFIWEGITRTVKERPWTGYGYGVVWTTEGPRTPLAKIVHYAGFRPYHAHSSWLEQWLGLGYVGLGLWAVMFVELWLKALYRLYRGGGGYFALPFLAVYSLSSVTESVTNIWNDLHWLLVVIVLVKLSLPDDLDSREVAPGERQDAGRFTIPTTARVRAFQKSI